MVTFTPRMKHYQKIHFPLVDTVCQALVDIFEHRYYADKVIERVLKNNPKMGSRDRAFVAETTYDIVRWWRMLNEAAGTGFQLDRQSLLKVISAYFFLFHEEKHTWKENSEMDFRAVNRRVQDFRGLRAVEESIPDWLDEMGQEELGTKWEKELKALNDEAPVVIRANTLKVSLDQLSDLLEKEGIETLSLQVSPSALQLRERRNIFRNEYFLNGFFEVQDAGSQCIAEFLEVKPGMRVIDACAGAGGKTLHLASLMENKGRIISMDVEERKLLELRKRASRAGAEIIETRLIDSSKVIKRLDQSADRLLLDVPCSGMGTLRRNPDAKWKLSKDFILKVRQIQKEILFTYSRMVKKGGLMVYATCSIFPSENEKQVEAFLKENPEFRLVRDRHLSPATNGTDGFYMALIERIV